MENGIPGKLRPWELGHVDLKTATIAAQNLVTADRDHQDHDELRFLYTNPQIQVILCEINIFCHQLTPNMSNDFFRFTQKSLYFRWQNMSASDKE